MDHFKLHSEYQPQETSLRLSKNWSRVLKKATSSRLCLVLPVPVRPSPCERYRPVK